MSPVPTKAVPNPPHVGAVCDAHLDARTECQKRCREHWEREISIGVWYAKLKGNGMEFLQVDGRGGPLESILSRW